MKRPRNQSTWEARKLWIAEVRYMSEICRSEYKTAITRLIKYLFGIATCELSIAAVSGREVLEQELQRNVVDADEEVNKYTKDVANVVGQLKERMISVADNICGAYNIHVRNREVLGLGELENLVEVNWKQTVSYGVLGVLNDQFRAKDKKTDNAVRDAIDVLDEAREALQQEKLIGDWIVTKHYDKCVEVYAQRMDRWEQLLDDLSPNADASDMGMTSHQRTEQ